MTTLLFTLYGYINGSILFARVFAKLLGKGDIVSCSDDKNPGTSNAFKYGGFVCGTLTLIFDILKGFIPVFLFMLLLRAEQKSFSAGIGIVMAAPVVGHVFPLFFGFRGGKGIATTFGCLLGLLPVWQPLAMLAMFFVFFSVVLQISPHYHRTIAAYFCSIVSMVCFIDYRAIAWGFLIITVAVYIRMFTSKEQREKMRIKFLWIH